MASVMAAEGFVRGRGNALNIKFPEAQLKPAAMRSGKSTRKKENRAHRLRNFDLLLLCSTLAFLNDRRSKKNSLKMREK